jgi:two-component system, LytTR family, sensor kinase
MYKKYLIRAGLGVVFYYVFKLVMAKDWSEFTKLNGTSFLFLLYTVSAILIIWAVAEKAVHILGTRCITSKRLDSFKLFFRVSLVIVPLVLVSVFAFHNLVKTPECCNNVERFAPFWVDTVIGTIIAFLIISYEVLRLSTAKEVQTAREKEMVEKELIAAKFEGLKNQVNPHFLFNSFSVLTSLVEKDQKTAVEFISKLSDMYRYILEHDKMDLVPLKCEKRFLNDYLFLLNLRHQNGIDVKVNLENLDESVKLPPLSLQILVENAVKHNSFSHDEPLVILVTSTDDGFIEVRNPKRPKSELVNSTGIGLRNLSRRLSLSVRRGLDIIDKPHEFKVKLPFQPA